MEKELLAFRLALEQIADNTRRMDDLATQLERIANILDHIAVEGLVTMPDTNISDN